MPQTQSAEATIRGFLFQFQETVIQIFDSDEKITIEGLDQDIELENLHIQCKYYKNWGNSNLAKAIIPLYKYFLKNPNKNISYQLNLHVTVENTAKDIKSDIEALRGVLKLSNIKLKDEDIKNADLKLFQEKITIYNSNSTEINKEQISQKLAEAIGLKNGEFLYNAVIGKILGLSTTDSVKERVITQNELLSWVGDNTQILALEWLLARDSESNYQTKINRLVKVNLHTRTLLIFNLNFENIEVNALINLIKVFANLKRQKCPIFCFDNLKIDKTSEIKEKLYKYGKLFIDEYPFFGSTPKLDRFRDGNRESTIKFIFKGNIESLLQTDDSYSVLYFYDNLAPEIIHSGKVPLLLPINSINQLLKLN